MHEPCLVATSLPSTLLSAAFLVLLVYSQPAAALSWLPFRRWLGSPNHDADPLLAHLYQKRDYGFLDPSTQGGSMLTAVPNTYPEGLGEPLNVIITANSDPNVLIDREDQGGLRNYFLSLGFSSECLGQSLGSKQAANLGDGHGYLNETAVIRWNYGDPYVGSCKETINGGNHFRYWTQNGPDANTGAVFMAASYEQTIKAGHDIHLNGYNLGRDWIVGNATGFAWPDPNPLQFVPTPDEISSTSLLSLSSLASLASVAALNATLSPSSAATLTQSSVPTTSSVPVRHRKRLTAAGATGNLAIVPNSQVVGTTSANNYTYQTTSVYVTGLVGNTSEGINHYLSVPENGLEAVDGMVAVLVVKIISTPDGVSGASLLRLSSIPLTAAMLLSISVPLIVI